MTVININISYEKTLVLRNLKQSFIKCVTLFRHRCKEKSSAVCITFITKITLRKGTKFLVPNLAKVSDSIKA